MNHQRLFRISFLSDQGNSNRVIFRDRSHKALSDLHIQALLFRCFFIYNFTFFLFLYIFN